MRTPWKAALVLAVGAAGGAAAVAVASVPDSSGVIHACVAQSGTLPSTTAPNLTLIDPAAGQTCMNALGRSIGATVAWNVTGPQGPPGTNGANGANGAPGRSVTIAGGNTLTIAGGQVVHVGTSSGLTITPPALGKKPIATLTLTDGKATITSAVIGFSLVHGSTGASGAANRNATHDIVVTKHTDKSSAKLFQACATGKHFSKARLVLSKAGHSTTYGLTNVLISTAQANSTKGSSQPTETLTLNFTKITFKSS